jgi:5'-deoxynucleotidase YfbR-like HD superfamily hydrolase
MKSLLGFFKNMCCLKELPRHGFAIFGLKRGEADSFAGHMFTTASLAYLLSVIAGGSPRATAFALIDTRLSFRPFS